MSKEKENGLGVRPGQVISAALAAVTAAVLGSTMGLAGTVIGAGLASVVTTVAGALYLHSLERTKAGVQLVRERVRSGVTGHVIIEREVTTQDQPDEAKPEDGAEEPPKERPSATRAIRWGAVVAGSVLAFVLGMLAITGYEKLTGGSLSGGTGTTVGGVFHPKQQDQQQQRQDDTPTPTTTPSPLTKTVTVPADPTTTSGSSTSSTTEAPPTTTTTPGGTTTTSPPTTTTTPNGDVSAQ